MNATRISSNVEPGVVGLSMVMVIAEVLVGWNPQMFLSCAFKCHVSISRTLIVQESDSVTSEGDPIITCASSADGLLAVSVVAMRGSRECDDDCNGDRNSQKTNRIGDIMLHNAMVQDYRLDRMHHRFVLCIDWNVPERGHHVTMDYSVSADMLLPDVTRQDGRYGLLTELEKLLKIFQSFSKCAA